MPASSLSFAPVIQPYPRGHRVHAHAHVWPQLLYASSGIMRVDTVKGSWVVPPQHGVWLPSKCIHEIHVLTDVQVASLHLEECAEWSQYDCEVLEIAPLLRELILAILAAGRDAQWQRRTDLMAQLIVEELTTAKRGAGPIPMPRDPRLLALCRRILNEPSAHVKLEDLALAVGSGSKTVARLFERELGMSFRQWRDLVHVAAASAYLEQGRPVKVVASLLGYTPSAFSVMMRRNVGVPPQAIRRVKATPQTDA